MLRDLVGFYTAVFCPYYFCCVYKEYFVHSCSLFTQLLIPIGWVILIQSMAPSIELKLWPFFASYYDNILNISKYYDNILNISDLFFLGEVPTMFLILSFNNDLKEYWAPGASPGVVVIFTWLFNWALRCLIR